MSSTYTTNLGIEKIATGEQSGTWGDTTNTNFDLIDQAVNGVEQITLAATGSSGSPNDLPITDGTASGGRNKFIEFVDGGDLGGTAFVQLTPNDAEKVVFIRNSLSADRTITIFQGTYNASNDFVIPNGADVVLKFDGAGTGATVTDVYVNLTPTKLTTADLVATTADINGGTIDGATINSSAIGGSTPAAGSFTTITGSGDMNIDSGTLFVDASENRVGIGTNTPDQILHVVSGNVDAVARFESSDSRARIEIKDNSTTNYIGIEAEGDEFKFLNSDERMRIDSSGNVGINTSDPDCLFHVVTTDTFDPTDSRNTAGIFIENDGGTDGDGNFSTGLTISKINSDRPYGAIAGVQTGADNDLGGLAFFTSPGTGGSDSLSEAMRIDSSGDVGIGTDSPDEKLDVNGDIRIQGTAPRLKFFESDNPTKTFEFGLGGGNLLVVDDLAGTIPVVIQQGATDSALFVSDNGNVGIGTGDPGSALSVRQTAASHQIIRITRPNSNTAAMYLGNDSSNNALIASNNEELLFGKDSGGSFTEYMRIDDSGNVGIGTSSPAGTLDVNSGTSNVVATFRSTDANAQIRFFDDSTTGNFNSVGVVGDDMYIQATGDVFFSPSVTEAMRIDSDGKVGIGTSSPRATLDVSPTGGATNDFNVLVSQFRPNICLEDTSSSSSDFQLFVDGGRLEFRYGDASTDTKLANESMRIISNGNVLMGTTSTEGERLRVEGTSGNDDYGAFHAQNLSATAAAAVASFATATNSTATSNVLIKFGSNGFVTGQGQINANGSLQAAFGSFSDRRLKENIVDLPPQLDNILALRPVEFDYIESEGGGHQVSFIAQEFEKVYPDAVGERGDGMKTLTGWDKTTARLVKAIQEQQEQINELKAEVAALKGV